MAETPRNTRFYDPAAASEHRAPQAPLEHRRSRLGALGVVLSWLIAAPLTVLGGLSFLLLLLLIIAPYFPEGEDPLTGGAGTLGGAMAAIEEPGRELDHYHATRTRDMENLYVEREMEAAGEIERRAFAMRGAIDQQTIELEAGIRAVDEQLLTSHITNFGAEIACIYALSNPDLAGTCQLAEMQRTRNLEWRAEMLEGLPRLAHSREDILDMIEVSEEDLIRTEMRYQVPWTQ